MAADVNTVMTVNYPGLWVAGGVLVITIASALMTWQWHSPGVFFALLVVMALIAAVLYSLANSVPESEVGGLLIGTLISAFTLIMGWLFNPNRRPPEPEAKREHPTDILEVPPKDKRTDDNNKGNDHGP